MVLASTTFFASAGSSSPKATLPEHDNAYTYICDALRAYVSSEHTFDAFDLLGSRARVDDDGPPGLTDWLNANKQAILLLDKAGSCHSHTIPPNAAAPLGDFPYPERGLWGLTRLKLLNASSLARRGMQREALGELQTLFAIFNMGRAEPTGDYAFILWSTLEGLCLSWAQRWVRSQELEEDVALVLSRMGEQDAEGSKALREQVDAVYRCVSRQLAAVASMPDVSERISAFYASMCNERAGRSEGATWRARFGDHPDSFLPAHTKKAADKFFDRCLVDIGKPWWNRDTQLQKELEGLRSEYARFEELLWNYVLCCLNQVLEPTEIEALPSKESGTKGAAPLREDLQELAGMLATRKDVIGMSWLSGRLRGVSIMKEMEIRRRAERSALALMAAVKLYERRRRVPPESLDELVTEGIVKSVPADPFSGGPMRYSAVRRVVWSTGADGNDDGGMNAAGEAWAGRDRVWALK
jgi:hypothetical protein